jgi:hypothetical protein
MSDNYEMAAIISDALAIPKPGEKAMDSLRVADRLAAAGYSKPRTITTAAQLEALPFGSAVQTSDESDTVVLRCEGNNFRNQSGADLSATDLWRYGTHPFTVLYSPEASA